MVWFSDENQYPYGPGSLESDGESSASSTSWWTGSELKSNSSSWSDTESPTQSKHPPTKIRKSNSPIVISIGDDSSSDSESIDSSSSSQDDRDEVQNPQSQSRGQLALIRSLEESYPVGIMNEPCDSNDSRDLPARDDEKPITKRGRKHTRTQRFNDENVLPAESQDSMSLQIFYDTATVWKDSSFESQSEDNHYSQGEESLMGIAPLVVSSSRSIIGPPSERIKQANERRERRKPISTTERFKDGNVSLAQSRDSKGNESLCEMATVNMNPSYESQKGEEVEAEFDLLARANSFVTPSSSNLEETPDSASDAGDDDERSVESHGAVDEKAPVRSGGQRATALVSGVSKAISKRLRCISRRRKLAALNKILSEMEEDISSSMCSRIDDECLDVNATDTEDKSMDIRVNIYATSPEDGIELNLQSSPSETTESTLACASASQSGGPATSPVVEREGPLEEKDEISISQGNVSSPGVQLPPYMKRKSVACVGDGLTGTQEPQNPTSDENESRTENSLPDVSWARLALAACCSLHYMFVIQEKKEPTSDEAVSMTFVSPTPSEVSVPVDVEQTSSVRNDGDDENVTTAVIEDEYKEPEQEQNVMRSDILQESASISKYDDATSPVTVDEKSSRIRDTNDQSFQYLEVSKSRSFGYGLSRAMSRRLRRQALKAKIKGLQSDSLEQKTLSPLTESSSLTNDDTVGVDVPDKGTVSSPCSTETHDTGEGSSAHEIDSPPFSKTSISSTGNIMLKNTSYVEDGINNLQRGGIAAAVSGDIQNVSCAVSSEEVKRESQSTRATSDPSDRDVLSLEFGSSKEGNSTSPTISGGHLCLPAGAQQGTAERETSSSKPQGSFNDDNTIAVEQERNNNHGNILHTASIGEDSDKKKRESMFTNINDSMSSEPVGIMKNEHTTPTAISSGKAPEGIQNASAEAESDTSSTTTLDSSSDDTMSSELVFNEEEQNTLPNDNEETHKEAQCIHEKKSPSKRNAIIGPPGLNTTLPVTMATSFDSQPWWDSKEGASTDTADLGFSLIPCRFDAPAFLQDKFDAFELIPLDSYESVDSIVDLDLSLSESPESECSVQEADSVSVADSEAEELVGRALTIAPDHISKPEDTYEESIEMTPSEDPVDVQHCTSSDAESTHPEESTSTRAHDDTSNFGQNELQLSSSEDELSNVASCTDTQGAVATCVERKPVRVFSKKMSQAVSSSIQRRAFKMKARRAERRNNKILAESGMGRDEDLPSIAETNESSSSADSSKVSEDHAAFTRPEADVDNNAILMNNASLIEVDDAVNGEIEFYII